MDLNNKKSNFPKAINITWDDLENLVWDVYLNLNETGYDPDVVIAVARGGLVPARILLDYLQKKHICTFQMGHLTGDMTITENPILIYPLPEINLTDKKVLVVDDVSDEGMTMNAVVNYLSSKVGDIKTAVLVSKKDSRFKADFCPRVMDDWRWVLFPWSKHEDLVIFTEKALQITGGATIEEIIGILEDSMNLEIATRDIEKALSDMSISGEIEERDGAWHLL
ncbi:MAG TPA: phosphoribosyltransferase [Desulfomonilia bacterium]